MSDVPLRPLCVICEKIFAPCWCTAAEASFRYGITLSSNSSTPPQSTAGDEWCTDAEP